MQLTKTKTPQANECVPGLAGSHIDGWMSPAELYWLENIAQRMDSIIEVGSWKGRSTVCLASNCDDVTAVDHFQGDPANPDTEGQAEAIKKEFLKNTKGLNVKLMELPSAEAAEIAPMVDFVFLDGAHDYDSVITDCIKWTAKAKLLIAGHDYIEPDVKRAVHELWGDRVKRGYGSIWYVELGEGIGYLR